MESVLGQGSEFVIHLPAVANSQEAEPQNEQSLAGEGDDRMVLLVDDESSIRHVARRALERNGYHVLEAADGIEALAMYNAHRDNISLVVTDMSMPQMTGSELAGCLKGLDPELRILATSGRPPAETLGSVVDCFADFLPKPYTVAELLKSIDNVILRRPRRTPGAA